MEAARVEKILRNTKHSMEVEGFTIDAELENVGRKILTGELDVEDYVAAYIAPYK